MGLEEELTQALENTIDIVKGSSYYPHYFMRMLAEHGGVGTAKCLLAAKEPQTGLFELYHRGLLHVSMEAIILQERF